MSHNRRDHLAAFGLKGIWRSHLKLLRLIEQANHLTSVYQERASISIRAVSKNKKKIKIKEYPLINLPLKSRLNWLDSADI